MRFMFKAIFWFTLVVLFIPKDPEPDTVAEIPSNAIPGGAAQARLATFCREQPSVCHQTAAALTELDIQSDQGARLALQLLLQSAHPSSGTD